MIVVDSSALVAVLLREPDAARVVKVLSPSQRTLLPSPAHVETTMVMGRRLGEEGLRMRDALLVRQAVTVVAFTETHAEIARDAFLRFGKGRHPAGLNFGDCMSDAVARAEGLPLLFVGKDFPLTDVVAA